jgi:hypothetical protein
MGFLNTPKKYNSMQILVDFNQGSPIRDYPISLTNMLDDKDKQKESLYEFFLNYEYEDASFVGLDMFGLYALNNLILRHIVSDKIDEDDEEYLNSPSIDPKTVRIYELNDDGEETCIQNENGLIGKNYFNNYMNVVMDDFYLGLNYYK